MRIDLNCDMGESFGAWTMGNDDEMLKIVTSANIACGFHGGDPFVIHKTITLAKQHNVSVGAHPSFLDIWGFGRRPFEGDRPQDIEKLLLYQIGAVHTMARTAGHRLAHVKTHGALGNIAAKDPEWGLAVARAIKAVDADLIFIVLPNTETERAGEKLGLRLGREIYADRTYDDTGNLTPRREPGAVIHDKEAAATHVLRMLDEKGIVSTTGKRIPVRIDSIGVHGDSPDAVTIARHLKSRLESAGITLAPLHQVAA